MTKAMMWMSAPPFGQVSGSDSNSRASSMTQRQRAGERVLEAGVGGGELTALGAPVVSATSRPKGWQRHAGARWARARRGSGGGAAWAAGSSR